MGGVELMMLLVKMYNNINVLNAKRAYHMLEYTWGASPAYIKSMCEKHLMRGQFSLGNVDIVSCGEQINAEGANCTFALALVEIICKNV